MQFDQKTLVRIGTAIVVVIVGVLFRYFGGAPISDQAPPPSTAAEQTPPAVAEQPSTAAERPPGAEVNPPSRAPESAVPVSEGDFDYYLLVLSWSPTHCSGDAGHGSGNDMQCRSGRPFGFVLHGMWPQNEHGYPQSCESSEREVSPENMARALKVAPSETLVRHEWEKHGTCSGLSQSDFVSAEISAFQSVHVPSAYQAPQRPLVTTPDDVRQAFLAMNTQLSADQLSATCSRNELAEVWVCLDKSLHPRSCSAEVRKRHCGARQVHMLAVRGDWP